MHIETGEQPRVLVLTLHPVGDRHSCFPLYIYIRLAGPGASGDSPVPISHLPIEALGLDTAYASATISNFVWILGIQMYVFMFMQQSPFAYQVISPALTYSLKNKCP